MKTPLRLLLLCLLPLSLSPGCGAGGSGSSDEDLVYAFRTGDPFVHMIAATLLFGDTGAPFDGQATVLNDAQKGELLAAQALEDVAILISWAFAPRALIWDAVLNLRLDDELERLGDGHVRFPLVLAVAESEDEPGLLMSTVEPRVRMDETLGELRASGSLPRTGLAGGMDTSFRVEAMLTYASEGTREILAQVSSSSTPMLGGATVQLLDTNGTVLDQAVTESRGLETDLQLRAVGNDLTPRVRLRFLPLADDFAETIGVDLNFEPPPLEPRLISTGTGNEGVLSISPTLFGALYPDDEPAPDEQAVVLYGAHHMEAGRITAVGWDLAESVAPLTSPPGTTYRGALIGTYGTYDTVIGGGTYQVVPATMARLAGGSWGLSLAQYDVDARRFDSDVIVASGNITDVTPFFGETTSGEAVYVDNTNDTLAFVTRDSSGDYVLDPGATLTNAVWAGASGKVVSAFMHASGDLLFVTDGDPGELWVLPQAASSATKITDVGTSPRTVRAAGDIAVVGTFGGGGLAFGALHILVRSGAGTWGRAPFSLSGPRVVGLDMKQLPNDRVALASTSYFANTLRIDVIDGRTGEVLKDDVLPVPAGCTLPAHCAFVEGPGPDAVLVSCNGSGHIALMPISFEE